MKAAEGRPGRQVIDRRRAGVLLHPTSLPSQRLDEEALRFLDLLAAGGFAAWQMLPLGPVGSHGSPYSPSSAFAGNVLLLPRQMLERPIDPDELQVFRAREAGWLEDYVLFSAIHHHYRDAPWWQWPPGLRWRHPDSMAAFSQEYAAELDARVRGQFLFEHNWQQVLAAARERDILLYGDLPMFVVTDSADVWSHPELFKLDDQGRPRFVAGVPPDAFAADGQCWGNPVYDWEQAGQRLYDWWSRRLDHECRRFDLVRWDHFRGLQATWEIPVTAGVPTLTALDGQWREVPGEQLLRTLDRTLGRLPIVAENLGVITDEVEQLRHQFHLPGMHVLQFAFDDEGGNIHLPEQHEAEGVVYTGTHDNDTTLGWYRSLDADKKARLTDYFGAADPEMPDTLIDCALESRARLAMIPAQDLLGLGSEARMNRPGRAADQWRWRLGEDQFNTVLAREFLPRLRASQRA